MKHIIEAGTDAASMLLFDPKALPDQYDEKAKDDPIELLEEASKTGSAFWINTGGDGAYLLHAFVDEDVPEYLLPYLFDEESVGSFRVPSGRLYFTGAEYAFRDDDTFLRAHPHMGASFKLARGQYNLSLFRAEYPEGLMENELREKVTPAAYYLHQSMGFLVMLAVAGVISVIASFVEAWLLPATLPIGLGLVSMPFIVCMLPIFKATNKVWKEIQGRYPSVVAVLRADQTGSLAEPDDQTQCRD